MRGRVLHTLLLACLAALAAATGCGADAGGSFESASRSPGGDAGTGFGPGAASDAGAGAPRSDGGFVPEEEKEFDFASPVVVGQSIFVANETLDSIAVVDSESLSIETVLVGFRPTVVDGPDAAHSDRDDARVMVLNEGSHSVTVLEPESLETTSHSVPRASNALEVDPTGRRGVVWYDRSNDAEEGAGDLSSVTVVGPEGTHRVAVGFHVRDVFFDRSGERALVLTDDGVSVIELTSLEGDTVARPIPLVPSELQGLAPEDLEVSVTENGRHVVTRSAKMTGIVLLDVQARQHHVVPLPVVPTDLDLVGGDPSRVLVMLRGVDRAVRASVPTGLVAASNALASKVGDIRVGASNATSGSLDAGVGSLGVPPRVDAHADTSAPMDAGADTSRPIDAGVDTSGATDAAPTDTMGGDAMNRDVDVSADTEETSDATGDGSNDTEGDTEADGGTSDEFFPEDLEEFEVYDVSVPGLGSATFGARGRRALLYSARGADAERLETRVVLLNFSDDEQSTMALEKGVRGAVSGRRGRTFVVFNTKQPGSVPDDASPGDPEYIARSWGVTLIDAPSTSGQLLLTAHEPGPTALWAADEGAPRLYMAFKAPDRGEGEATHRDVVEVNLETFRKRTHRMPSIPEALGPIRPARKVFVHQRHSKGRMTFLDVATSTRQTITGYQLNATIQ
jgi:hypothetical protein